MAATPSQPPAEVISDPGTGPAARVVARPRLLFLDPTQQGDVIEVVVPDVLVQSVPRVPSDHPLFFKGACRGEALREQ